MPRRTLEIEPTVAYLGILNENGEVDEALVPPLDGDALIGLYRTMLSTRRLDERLINMQRQGRIGTYGPVRGQEAVHAGTAAVLRPDDWTAQSFREMGVTLARGWPMHAPMYFWGGYEEGNVAENCPHDLPITVPVASQALHAVGIAWAMKIKQRDSVCMTFCGDGGTSEGDFHEALNFAGVYDLPVVFVVQNNHFAISCPRRQQTRSKTIAQKAVAYGFDGIQVDGNDPLAVYVAAQEAVDKARAGGGPTLIECVTYRLSVHTTADDPTKYRSTEEVRQWEKRDPIPRFDKYLRDRGILDEASIEGIEADIQESIKAAIAHYESNQQADPLDAFRYVYAEPGAEIAAQQEELVQALKAEGWYSLQQ